MGICPNLHSEPLRIQYELLEISKKKEFGYEQRLGRFLDELVYECDKTIERQEHKLKETEAEKMENDPMTRQIAELQAQAEKAGEEGKVDEYIRLSGEIKLLEQKRQHQQVMLIPTGAAGEVIQQHGPQSQQQKLRVCEVCSCFLSKFDSDKRLADHFNGKLHVGYVTIREKLEELKHSGLYNPDDNRRENFSSAASSASTTTVIRHSKERVRDEPYSSRDRERDSDRDRDRDRERDRDRRDRDDRHKDRRHYDDRDRKDSDHRGGNRDRDYDRKRRRSSETHRRSRSRDDHKRDRHKHR